MPNINKRFPFTYIFKSINAKSDEQKQSILSNHKLSDIEINEVKQSILKIKGVVNVELVKIIALCLLTLVLPDFSGSI